MEFLKDVLMQETAVEKLQKETGKNINTMNLNYHASIVPEIPKFDFFDNSPIFVTKHNRFSYTPAHTHSFIEVNYFVSGKSLQRLNGDKFSFQQGQLLLLDRNVIQHIEYVESNNLIVNILLDPMTITSKILPNIFHSSHPLINFLLQAADKHNDHQNYLVIDLNNDDTNTKLMELLLLTGLTSTHENKSQLLILLFCSLITQIITAPILHAHQSNTKLDFLLPILKYLNDHYKDVSLQKLGNEFGYNKNYLSNLLKDKTGSSFQELLDQKRLSEAMRLMQETNKSLDSIALEIGYKSVPSLFKLFKKETGQTPNFFRNQKN